MAKKVFLCHSRILDAKNFVHHLCTAHNGVDNTTTMIERHDNNSTGSIVKHEYNILPDQLALCCLGNNKKNEKKNL